MMYYVAPAKKRELALMEPKFIHLRLHTEYSLSDGLIVIPSLMKKIEKDAMPAIAITDRYNLYATVKFYQEAFKTGIKPIIGVDLQIINDHKPKETYLLTL